MRVVSVNVSPGRTVEWQGRSVETGIFKEPVQGRVLVRRLNIEGDRQSDLSVHGGEHKAVYAYSLEHYPWWRGELGRDLPFGAFGENLTIEGFPEEEVCVGDALRVGEAVLEAAQPRMPCFKLGIRFGDAGMVKRFLASGRWGVYFRVLEEGSVAAGDAASWVRKDPERFPVPELVRMQSAARKDAAQLRRAAGLRALAPEWKEEFREQLLALEGGA